MEADVASLHPSPIPDSEPCPHLFSSCAANWDTYSSFWNEVMGTVVGTTLSKTYKYDTAQGMLVTAYFPFKNGIVVEAVLIFKFALDGSIANEGGGEHPREPPLPPVHTTSPPPIPPAPLQCTCISSR